MWRVAQDKAQTALVQSRQQAHTEVAQAQAERDQAHGEIQRLGHEAETRESQLIAA